VGGTVDGIEDDANRIGKSGRGVGHFWQEPSQPAGPGRGVMHGPRRGEQVAGDQQAEPEQDQQHHEHIGSGHSEDDRIARSARAYAIGDWLKQRQIKAIYIKPGSPWENGHIESFHDKFRDECLNREIFGSLLEAKVLVEQWRMEYNTSRPRSSLRYQTPQEVADRWQTSLRAASASTTENINNRSELHF
jgi:hypothetical protein